MSTGSLFEFRQKYIKAALAALNAIDLSTATQTDLMIHGALLKTLDTVGQGAPTIDISTGDMGYVGVAYNPTLQQWVRLGSAQGLPVGAFPGGAALGPVFQRLRRVALKDDGTVFRAISWLSFTQWQHGGAADLTGASGQIMVEYLPAWYKAGLWGEWSYFLISHLPLEGFELFPLFEGKEAAYRGAYEASVHDGKLCSIAKNPADGIGNVYPVTTRAGVWGHASLTTAATDSLAAARGAGWRQSHLLSCLWERILMIVGYASYNIPGIVGAGRINLSGGDWLNDNYIGRCGLGDVASGYASAVQVGGSAGYLTDYAQVLGIENPWGNVWERVAALISEHRVFYRHDPPYNYGSTAEWERLRDAAGIGISLPTENGWANRPHSGLGLVLPAALGGSSSSGMFDYFWQDTGLRVPLVGGDAAAGANAGPFYVGAGNSATSTSAAVGGRLCFERHAPA